MKLFNTIIAASALTVVASLFTSVDAGTKSDVQLFNDFIVRFEKPYANDSVERARRFKIFQENMREAERLAQLNPHATYGSASPFSDLTAAEFKVYHNADKFYAKAREEHKKLPAHQPKIKNLSDAGKVIDWRQKGAVTAVKNQGQCGSCWAFSTTGVLEGQWFLAGNPLTSLSEQFFVSCDTLDSACNGGLPSTALTFAVTGPYHGELPTEASYPYVSGNGNAPACQTSGWKVGAHVQGQRAVTSSEPHMWGALYGDGPISIGVDASQGWQSYTGGIVTNCPAGQLDHGVLIVGINLDYHIPYWVVKNSWTATWGEQGYIRLQYGTNQCGLSSVPVLAIINNSTVPTPAPLPPTPAPTPAPPTPVPPPTPEAAGWNLQFPPSGIPLMQEAMGLSMVGERAVYVSGMVTGSGAGVGPQVGIYDGQVEGSITLLQSQGLPFMEMETAIAGMPGYPKGAICGLMFPIIDKSPFAYIANTTNILPSNCVGCGLMSVVQGCSASTDGNYVLGADQGSSGNSMQALLSTDGGKNFRGLPFGNAPIAQPNCTFPRYAAVASEQVFYVTLGDWGSNNSQVSAHYHNVAGIQEGKKEWRTTATRKYVYDEKTRQTKYISQGPMEVYKSYRGNNVEGSSASGSSSGYCGNSAEILRTADGGNTWTSVFSSVDKFYFNEIACFDATHCLAVGEGFNENAGVRIFQTTDGTTWNQVFFMASTNARAYSFFSVEIADRFSGEAWVGGSYQLPDQQAGGLLYHTKDFGKTWAKFEHSIPSLAEITQISFSANTGGQIGYLTAMTTYQSSNIARFDRTKIGPGPNEQSFFTQLTCLTASCNLLCQAVEFAEYMCIPANNGGSIQAYCTATELVQTYYETTDCSGKGQNSNVALNTCLSNQGQYFEFTCNGTSSSKKFNNQHRPRRIADPKKDKVMHL